MYPPATRLKPKGRNSDRSCSEYRYFAAATLLTISVFLSSTACSCDIADSAANPDLRFAAYNVQNLFDDVLKGDEYDEFKPGQENWDSLAYHTRLERLARTLYALGKTSNSDPLKGPVYHDPGETEPGEIAHRTKPEEYPDFVVFEEIESQKVIDDLVRDHLPSDTYMYALVQSEDGGLIHVALLSKFPVISLHSHKFWVDGQGSRAVWEIALDLPHIQTDGDGIIDNSGAAEGQSSVGSDGVQPDLIVFENHWKSKSGGEAEGEGLRVAAAKVIAARAEALNNSGVPLLILGDLNETILPGPDAPKQRALGSWDANAVNVSSSGGNGSQPAADAPILRIALRNQISGIDWDAPNSPRWISPWSDSENFNGSYFYDGSWEAIDHAFMNPAFFDGKGLEYKSFKVGAGDFLLDGSNAPYRYDAWKGKGFSDHLPIMVDLSVHVGE